MRSRVSWKFGGVIALGAIAVLSWMGFHRTPKSAAPEPRAYGRLAGRSVAILATDAFDAKWLIETRARLAGQGARTFVVAPNPGTVVAKDALTNEDKIAVDVDISLPIATAASFDALVMPGGEGAQSLRDDPRALAFIGAFVDAKKPIAAVGEAPAIVAETRSVAGRDVTAAPHVRRDLERSGAVFRDDALVADGELITCRNSAETRVVSEKLARTITPAVPKASLAVSAQHAHR